MRYNDADQTPPVKTTAAQDEQIKQMTTTDCINYLFQIMKGETKKMKLYELDNEYLDFIAAVEDGTIPEDAIEDTLEMLDGDYKDKLDNTICAIKNLTAEAKMIDDEIKALTARKKAKENSADWLKGCVSRSMQCRGESYFESARNKVTFRKSERLVITDEAAFAEKYPEFVTFTPKISKTDVKTAVKSGKSFDGTDIVEVQNIQIK